MTQRHPSLTETPKQVLTYRYRVKSLQGELNRQARAVNAVWNYCLDAQRHALRWTKRWPSHFDLNKLTSGSGAHLGLGAMTIESVCKRFSASRNQHGPRLRFRGERSLGWVPMRGKQIHVVGDAFRIGKRNYRVFSSRPIPAGAQIKDGCCFSQDSRRRWYLNVVIEVDATTTRKCAQAVGIDLGLKSLATLSTGELIENPRHVRALADKLGRAQRAGRKRQVSNIHARIQNARRDFLHKLSTRLVREFDYIAVGNVASAHLARTSMAKSVLDAGWSSLRLMLAYKSIANGARYEEVDERLTTQVCSSCGCLPPERPRGIADLGIRQWTCSCCGARHDRDVNAARNILARSRHRTLVEGAVPDERLQRCRTRLQPVALGI